ncbi:MAG: hypothetical protein IJ003_03640 [Candidatus Gastranaerophilales bacterium]|nr:hypothetical protein [Candidatus Gastranaerophilales bacterium]
MRHCNSVFQAEDIWFLIDKESQVNRRLYIANCPICNKKMALYFYCDNEHKNFYEQYFYSGGAVKIKEKFKKEVASTLLGYKNKYKAPSGFKYGKNIEIKKNGKIIAIEQYACDFYGNKVLIKKIENE